MGEENMAEYISGLDMSALVLDYDHNSPDEKHLLKTHKKFFNIVRAKNPGLPIIIASAIPCTLWSDEFCKTRKKIIFDTYLSAVNAGDKNVYFLDGEKFFTEEIPFDECTVDGIHPNDTGMHLMANGFMSVLRRLKL